MKNHTEKTEELMREQKDEERWLEKNKLSQNKHKINLKLVRSVLTHNRNRIEYYY